MNRFDPIGALTQARGGFIAAALASMALAGQAMGHTGEGHVHAEGSAFVTGLLHPVSGFDHLLAMLAVGLWAALAGGRAVWALPVVFLAAMLAGGVMGHAGVWLPGVEPMILASVVLAGAAAALALRLPLPPALAAVAVFGLAHGHAHGTEGPASGLLAYAGGFVMASAALLALGVALALAAQRGGQPVAGRALGGVAALAGIALVFV